MARLVPLYTVIFVGFVGYSLMITVFTPMLMYAHNGMLASDSRMAQRTIVLGVLLSLYPLGQFVGALDPTRAPREVPGMIGPSTLAARG